MDILKILSTKLILRCIFVFNISIHFGVMTVFVIFVNGNFVLDAHFGYYIYIDNVNEDMSKGIVDQGNCRHITYQAGIFCIIVSGR